MKVLKEVRGAMRTSGLVGASTLLLGMAICGLAAFYATTLLLEPDTRQFTESSSTEAFNAAAPGIRMLGTGWSTPEAWGTWSVGSKAELVLKLDPKPADDVQLALEARGFPHLVDNLQKIHVSVNGTRIASLEPNFEGVIRNAVLKIPATVANLREPMQVLFEIARPTSPRDLNLGNDTRALGIGLMGATLRYRSEVERNRIRARTMAVQPHDLAAIAPTLSRD